MVAPVATAPSFKAEVPRVLFERSDLHDVHSDLQWGGPYDVTRDGRHIVMNVTAEERTSQPTTIVLNWMVEL